MRLSPKELNYCINDVFVTTNVFNKIVKNEMERRLEEMENVIYKGFIERQVTTEAAIWFDMEDAKNVKVNPPELVDVTDSTLTYRVLVVFVPNHSKEVEAAILTVLVNSHGANVVKERRTDMEGGNHD